MDLDELTPKKIVDKLNEHIIGQIKAKRAVAIALRNRSRRMKLDPEIREEVYPKNIIMIGPTGVGKTEIARRIAKLSGAPFIKVEITKYTEVGYVGRDVSSMIRDLAKISLSMVKKEFREKLTDKAYKIAVEKVLDILLPPPPVPKKNKNKNKKNSDNNFNQDSGKFESEVEESYEELLERYKESRRIMKEKLLNGDLDNNEIELNLKSSMKPPVLQFYLRGSKDSSDEFDQIAEDWLNDDDDESFSVGNNKKKKMTIKEAIKELQIIEADKMIDADYLKEVARKRVEELGIVFLDEIDKIASRENRSGVDVSREGVQRDLLPIVEGSTVNTKIGPIKTDHILFIAAGAFHISKPSDLIPELQGRFPIRVELDKLTKDDYFQILNNTKISLVMQYKELLKQDGVNLEFTHDGIEEIARIAYEMNEKNENIGARRLNTIMEKVLEDISFEAPDLPEDKKHVIINKSYVEERLKGILEDRDLSRFIL